MQHKYDYIYVGKDLVINSNIDSTGLLTNGIISIRGNFSQLGNKYSFVATDNHKVIFCGDIIQTIFFESPKTSCFNRVDAFRSKGINCCYEYKFDIDNICPESNMIAFMKKFRSIVSKINSNYDYYDKTNLIINAFVNSAGYQYIGRADLQDCIRGNFGAIYNIY